MKPKKSTYYMFVKQYQIGGTTIYPGVSLKGDFIVTDHAISQRDSTFFVDIPKEYLELVVPKPLEPRSRSKQK